MKRGGKFLVSSTAIAVAACGGQQGKLEIRSTPKPLSQIERSVPQRIAEARGLLALGNVGLALTSFRIAVREDPNSVDALAGIAASYDQMGRFDLSRRYYESALALAPADSQLLAAFAASLQLQGKTEEALSVRQEVAGRLAAAHAPNTAPVADEVQLAATEPTRPAPAPVATPAKVAPPVSVTAVPEAEAAPPPQPKPRTAPKPIERPEIRVATLETQEKPALTPKPAPVVKPAALGPTVTVKLPPARKVAEAPVPEMAKREFAPSVPSVVTGQIPAHEPTPVDIPQEFAHVALLRPIEERIPEPAVVTELGPRIERVSMGEIALITVPKPTWKPTTVAVSQRATKVRFVPLRQASLQPAKVRLLNAARVNRLAARTRHFLNARGWRGLAIGNASTTRARSVILYPAKQRAAAQRLSAQFGFPLSRRASGSHIVVLLGSDAARLRALQPRRA
jgi:hypothetical protein